MLVFALDAMHADLHLVVILALAKPLVLAYSALLMVHLDVGLGCVCCHDSRLLESYSPLRPGCVLSWGDGLGSPWLGQFSKSRGVILLGFVVYSGLFGFAVMVCFYPCCSLGSSMATGKCLVVLLVLLWSKAKFYQEVLLGGHGNVDAME
ncbi:hypothetical protein U1Q18_006562 [Sarracenia purpurea var. burkii]